MKGCQIYFPKKVSWKGVRFIFLKRCQIYFPKENEKVSVRKGVRFIFRKKTKKVLGLFSIGKRCQVYLSVKRCQQEKSVEKSVRFIYSGKWKKVSGLSIRFMKGRTWFPGAAFFIGQISLLGFYSVAYKTNKRTLASPIFLVHSSYWKMCQVYLFDGAWSISESGVAMENKPDTFFNLFDGVAMMWKINLTPFSRTRYGK